MQFRDGEKPNRIDGKPCKISISIEAMQRLKVYSLMNGCKPTKVIDEFLMGLDVDNTILSKLKICSIRSGSTEVDSKAKSLTPQCDVFFANKDTDVDDDLTAMYKKGK